MTTLTVNGVVTRAGFEPRLHLADFVRERLLLTGTHLGCEHGVCGACTILLDGEPARACITFAADCEGRDIRTIEGLAEDLVMVRLRAAFSAEHALQCGYCTPGMLVTARDIVRRLPDADDDRVRLELAGNLCRCTGYLGIVRAIRRVLDEHLPPDDVTVAPVAAMRFEAVAPSAPVVSRAMPVAPAGDGIAQRVLVAASPDAVWAALHDPVLVASCVPGAVVTEVAGDRVTGTLQVALGPMKALFSGSATLAYDDAARTGMIEGDGADRGSATRLGVTTRFFLAPDGAGSVITLDTNFSLRGPLARFARGPIVSVLAEEVATAFGDALGARLRGDAPVGSQVSFGAGRLVLKTIWRRLLAIFAPRR